MQMVLLNSKITIPQIMTTAVERERLYHLLQNEDPTKVVFLRAPAGYGKTTLLSQWFSQCDEPVAWFSIDVADNDPVRFWRYVIYIVSDAFQNEMDSKLFPLFNSQSPFELMIDSFLNEIGSFQGTIHIVIEDFHLIANSVIHETMARFIEYLPRNARVYVTSRTDLPLPIAKWRVKSWLTEIGMDQFRFTYEEIKTFYENRGLVYDDAESLQHVLDITEGWAAGVQLEGLSGGESTLGKLNVDALDSVHPFITEFLLKEILAPLSPSIQDFLVRTSILTPLEPAICNALTNRSDSSDVLLEFENRGLFIVRLHSRKPIFRYHNLFADALQIELKHRYSQEMISSIYKETAIHLHEKGYIISAIELVLQGQIYEVADAWITANLIKIFTSGETSTFMRWVQILRDASYPVNIETLVMNVITFATIHELEKANLLIEELERRQELDQWMDTVEYQGMATILQTVKAFVLFAGGEDIEQASEIIKKQLKEGRVSSRWDNIPMQYNLFEPQLLRTSIGSRGKLWPKEKALPFLNLFRETEFRDQNMTGFGYGVQAETLYENNFIDEALVELEEALQYGHRFKDLGLLIPMYILKSRIYVTEKNFGIAHKLLDFAIESTTEWNWIRSLHTMKAYCYLIEGDILKAEQELYISNGLNNNKVKTEQEFWLLVHARFLIAKKQSKEALENIIWVKEKALRERKVSTIIEAMVLEAICQIKLNQEDAALVVLHEALEQGARYGYVRSFLDEVHVCGLLKKYLKVRQTAVNPYWDSVPLTYIEQLLAVIPDRFIKGKVEHMLTIRERSVLQLLVNGASNIEIASDLALTEGTVRVYLSRIYRKLGVNSRTQAVLFSQEEEF